MLNLWITYIYVEKCWQPGSSFSTRCHQPVAIRCLDGSPFTAAPVTHLAKVDQRKALLLFLQISTAPHQPSMGEKPWRRLWRELWRQPGTSSFRESGVEPSLQIFVDKVQPHVLIAHTSPMNDQRLHDFINVAPDQSHSFQWETMVPKDVVGDEVYVKFFRIHKTHHSAPALTIGANHVSQSVLPAITIRIVRHFSKFSWKQEMQALRSVANLTPILHLHSHQFQQRLDQGTLIPKSTPMSLLSPKFQQQLCGTGIPHRQETNVDTLCAWMGISHKNITGATGATSSTWWAWTIPSFRSGVV